MRTVLVKQNPIENRNNGINLEWSLNYTLTGTITEKHDNTAFDKGSDIESLHISVKSARFTLASRLNGEDKDEMLNDYFERVASQEFAYITKDFKAYIMNAQEFKEFLIEWTSVERSSSKNGGNKVLRGKNESKAMLEWLGARA